MKTNFWLLLDQIIFYYLKRFFGDKDIKARRDTLLCTHMQEQIFFVVDNREREGSKKENFKHNFDFLW